MAEALQQIVIGNDLRVEIELEGLGVVSERVVGRVRRGATAVADAGTNHTVETPELSVWSPESPERECRGLDPCREQVDGGGASG